jgi:hypothetical protein
MIRLDTTMHFTQYPNLLNDGRILPVASDMLSRGAEMVRCLLSGWLRGAEAIVVSGEGLAAGVLPQHIDRGAANAPFGGTNRIRQSYERGADRL